ncbi:MAG: S8 family serine peptidase [Desulfobacterales bacterium]
MQTPLSPRSRTTLAAQAVLLACAGFLLLACGGGGGNGGSSAVAGGGAGTAAFTVSGEISVAANTAIDSDVNDPAAPYASNDLIDPATGLNDLDLVQRVSRLVTVGGYVNQPGQGTDGRSFATGDIGDYFVVDLTAGQTITLNTAESGSNIDLFLYMDQDFDSPVASSTSATDAVEVIQVNSPGTYFIEVRAVSGASNYTLNIATDAVGSQAASFTAENDFVPGDVIIKYKNAGVRADSAGFVSAGMTPTGLTHKAGEPGRAMLFSLNGASTKAQAQSRLSLKPGSDSPLALDPELQRKLQTLTVISELRNRADVAYAEPNYIRHQQLSPSDELYLRQWHYPLINLSEAWDTTTGDPDVIVAVIDTGVLFNHPDLSGRFTATGYDFVSNPASALDGNGIDPDPSDAGAQNPGTSIFHGSHVAGTIAAQTDNGVGVAGVGWRTQIMPVRAFGKGGNGDNYDIMQAVRYAAGLENDSGITLPQNEKADIINLSFSSNLPNPSIGYDPYSFLEQEVYDKVRAEGIILVAAAGNFASSLPVYPAAYQGVLAVSGVDINEQLAPYSNFGSYVDLTAPGGDLSDDLDGDGYLDGVLSTAANVDLTGNLSYVYSYLAGTSMAAAHASGVIALMKAVNPALTPADLDDLLVGGSITRDLGNPGRDDLYGYGLIDAQKAVLAAAPALLTVNPASLDFGTELSNADLTVDKTGPGPLAILSVSDDAAWLSTAKDPAAGDGDFPVQYSVMVDRTNLAPGDYGATISFQSDNNTVAVPVTMTVAAPPTLPAELAVSPTSLAFSTELSSADLTVAKIGPGSLAILSVSDDAAWLSTAKDPAAGDGDFPVQYSVQVDRTGLAPGIYGATITIVSDSNTVTVPVTMGVVSPTLLTVNPGSIFLGTTLSSADLMVDKNGTDSITVQSVGSDVNWLVIDEINPGAGEIGDFPAQYRVHTDRTGLDPGEYEATITFASENNIVEVPVVMQVADVADVVDGTLYVQLIDPDSFETVYRQPVTSEAGICRFSFPGVAAGRYLIFAGTNLDNDTLVGDAGEANGAYLSLAQPVTLQVDQNLNGLDFGVGFNPILSAQSRQASEPGRSPEFIPAF